VAGALENCNYPVEILAEQLDVPFSPGDGFPLFAIAVLVENIHDKKVLGGVHLDMIFSFKREGLSIGGCVEYNPSLYDGAAVERIAVHLQRLLENASANPEESIFALELMSPGENEQLLITFNDTGTDYPVDKTIHELFAEQVEKTPDRIALFVEGVRRVRPVGPVSLSYKELGEQSDRLACLLIEKGVLADDIVGIQIERSLEMVIGIMGILKAGGAYMPIDPGYPQERIDYMLKDSAAKIMIGRAEERKSGRAEFVFSSFFLASSLSRFLASDSSNLAYIIYTSGSTGQPKGVMVEHRNAVNVVCWFAGSYFLRPGSQVLQMSDYTFDPSVNQVFGTLLHGGVLHIIDKELLYNTEALRRFIDRHHIQVLNFVPLMLDELLGCGPRLLSVEVVLSGGEKLDESVKRRILDKGYMLYNQYGPTETTIDTLVSKCSLEKVTLGKPISNVQCFVFDKSNNLAPIGVAGELYIGGAGVARGYLNRPELTAEKFVKFNKSYKTYRTYILYKTGDLCRWLPGGNIEFFGRIDHQVKIRGYRIELGEIENRLCSHPKVKEALVITR
jgi:amino acid adenylation domain-containing protein